MAKTKAEMGVEHRIAERLRNQEKRLAATELQDVPFDQINWRRRNRAKKDIEYAAKTYLPNVFNLKFADYHKTLFQAVQETVRDRSKQAILLPRGGGKSMVSNFGALHGMLFGVCKWVFNIGANDDLAKLSLQTILTWLKSPILAQDFPEICYPLLTIGTDRPGSVARSQRYNGQETRIKIAPDEFRFPCLILPEEVARWYQKHDPNSVRRIEPGGGIEGYWIPKNGYSVYSSTGITGSIRGANIADPFTFGSMRPEIAIIDDIQTEDISLSPVSRQKYINIIEGSIRFLAGSDNEIGMLMPCTVIESNDIADTYGNPKEKPQWKAIRVPMVTKWPEGMSDTEITNDSETAILWQKYRDIWAESFQKHNDFRDATSFYRKNRAVMDRGFEVSWKERFSKNCVSAIQYAMNLRFENHRLFLSNCQQVGGTVLQSGQARITAKELAAKQSSCAKGFVPERTQTIVAFIDVQKEYFAYCVLAAEADFTSVICDYGTFPEFNTHFYRRSQANEWKLLTQSYLQTIPHDSYRRIYDSAGNEKVNVTDMYTWGLETLVRDLCSRSYLKADSKLPMGISRIGIDSQEGDMVGNVRTVAKRFPNGKVIPFHGVGIRANRMGLDRTNKSGNAVFETDVNPYAGLNRWVYRYSQVGMMYELASDVNAWKDFLFARLETPQGIRGAMTIYKAPEFKHELFTVQVCESERPTEMEASGVRRNVWSAVPNVDNEFLDCCASCCCLASFERCCYVQDVPASVRDAARRKSFQERLAEKKRMNDLGIDSNQFVGRFS